MPEAYNEYWYCKSKYPSKESEITSKPPGAKPSTAKTSAVEDAFPQRNQASPKTLDSKAQTTQEISSRKSRDERKLERDAAGAVAAAVGESLSPAAQRDLAYKDIFLEPDAFPDDHALKIAVGTGRSGIVKSLLKHRENANITLPLDPTMLHSVAEAGDAEVVKLLLEHGADKEATDEWEDERALHAAARKGHLEIIKLLLDHGADIEAATRRMGFKALYIAVRDNQPNVVKLLLEYGANIDAYSQVRGYTPLHNASERGHVEIIILLLEHGANMEAATHPFGRTALYIAAWKNQPKVVELLLEYGADKEAVNRRSNEKALHAAARNGHLEIIKLLLEHGADTEAATQYGNGTALHIATHMNQPKVVELLLEHGADVQATTRSKGESALHIAARQGHLEIVQDLLSSGADVNAATNGAKDRTEVQNTRSKGESALHVAARQGHLKIIKLLLEHGADVQATNRSKGKSALHIAARQGHLEIVQDLLSSGADVNAATNGAKDRTAVQAAVLGRHFEVARSLLAAGADVNIAAGDQDTETALQTFFYINVPSLLAQSSDEGRYVKQLTKTIQEETGKAREISSDINAPGGGTTEMTTWKAQKGEASRLTEDRKLNEETELSERIPVDETKGAYSGASEVASESDTSSSTLWNTRCGQSFEEDIQERIPGAATDLAREINYPDEVDVTDAHAPSDECSSTSTSTNGCRPRKNGRQNKDVVISIDTGKNESVLEESMSGKKYILLCLSSRGSYERLKHANVTASKTDRCMYHVLKQGYFTHLRRSVRWLAMRTLDRVEFVRVTLLIKDRQFQLYWAANVEIEAGDVGSLPPNSIKEYEYDRQYPTRPIVPLTALKHFTEHPLHASTQPLHLKRIPKKVDGELAWQQDSGEKEGWGLRFRERICWMKVFIVEACWGTIAIIFAIGWCRSQHGGLQDGFTVAAVILAYGTIFLGLIQGVAQLLERR
ncbi:MAG: hypothetical protein M1836_000394 [Candelina mexicana]|nr:MAG: hypothetical protein M1836_000394 [Candelina mexicana]